LAVRTLFACSSREKTLQKCALHLGQYEALASDLTESAGRLSVEVPRMRGVDEDMRRWSFYMTLEHNTIVNRSITAVIGQLVRREPLHGAARIDPKHGVMPAGEAGPEQVPAFVESVKDHLRTVRELGPLRGTPTAPHPLFGPFDAHKWNCMFTFHLGLHLPQARYVAEQAKARVA
jgi:hypothetical protein